MTDGIKKLRYGDKRDSWVTKNWWQIVLLFVMITGQVGSYMVLQADVKTKVPYKEYNVQVQKLSDLKEHYERDVSEIKNSINRIENILLGRKG